MGRQSSKGTKKGRKSGEFHLIPYYNNGHTNSINVGHNLEQEVNEEESDNNSKNAPPSNATKHTRQSRSVQNRPVTQGTMQGPQAIESELEMLRRMCSHLCRSKHLFTTCRPGEGAH